MWPLWAVALYIQLKIIFTIHSSTVNWYIDAPFKADLTSLHIITVSCKLHFCFNYSTLIPIIFHGLALWAWTPFKAMCTKYNTLCDKVCQWLATGRWFSPGTPASSSDKTDRHHITEIFLKVVLNTITLILSILSNPIDLLQNYIKVVL